MQAGPTFLVEHEWALLDSLQPCNTATLPPCHPATLQLRLLPFNFAAVIQCVRASDWCEACTALKLQPGSITLFFTASIR
jgi:hypothetical protein